MNPEPPTIRIASRGSALALVQANFVLGQCREAFPQTEFELKIIKTTGDKLQAHSLSRIDATLPRGLFTKELEDALLGGEADLAVHSLKDLPTMLPDGLLLGAVSERADARDVLIWRAVDGPAPRAIREIPSGATMATSSTRRSAQLLELRPDLKVVPIRGNVGTRLQKLATQPEFQGTILAAAGLHRLGFVMGADGRLQGNGIPDGLVASFVALDEMLPCVGQAALGIEIREGDERIRSVCDRFNHPNTWYCVNAERAFLRAMGGGCQSAVAAHAQVDGETLRLRAVSFLGAAPRRGDIAGLREDAASLGETLAKEVSVR